jgi:hypothetical protein
LTGRPPLALLWCVHSTPVACRSKGSTVLGGGASASVDTHRSPLPSAHANLAEVLRSDSHGQSTIPADASVILGVIALAKTVNAGKEAKVSGNYAGLASRTGATSCAKTGQNWLRSPKSALRLPASQPASSVPAETARTPVFSFTSTRHGDILPADIPLHSQFITLWSFSGANSTVPESTKAQVTFPSDAGDPAESRRRCAIVSCMSHIGSGWWLGKASLVRSSLGLQPTAAGGIISRRG